MRSHSHPHTNKVSHKGNLLSTHTEHHQAQKQAEASGHTERGRLSAMTYYMGGAKQINCEIMKRQKTNEQKPATPMSGTSVQGSQPCMERTTQPHVCRNHSHKESDQQQKKACIFLCGCVFVCSWVWARLQLRGEAIAIPTDLKTSLPATSKYWGKGKKRGRMSVGTKAMKIQRARFWNTAEWPQHTDTQTHTHTHPDTQTHTGAAKDYGKAQAPTNLCTAGSSEKKDRKTRWKDRKLRKGSHMLQVHTPNRTKTKSVCECVCLSVECDFVWVCGCVWECDPLLPFVTPRGSPRSRADPLSLSCPLFIHSFPLFFFYTLTPRSLPLF